MHDELRKRVSFDYAQVGGVRLHYAKAGNGPELVILLHGFPEFWYSWRHQLVDLSDDFTVVAPDLRGINLSDKPEAVDDYAVSNLVDDVAGLISQLGFEAAAVVGHDWGAGIAWTLARLHPEHVSKLACLQVPPPDIWQKNMTLKQLMASWYMFFFQLPKIPEMMLSRKDYRMLSGALLGTTARTGVISSQEIEEYKLAWAREGTITGGVNVYRANVLKRMFSKPVALPNVKVPTLFIYGEQDHAILPSTVEGVAEVVEGEYGEIRIPESAHWVQVEAREKVSGALLEFLRGEGEKEKQE